MDRLRQSYKVSRRRRRRRAERNGDTPDDEEEGGQAASDYTSSSEDEALTRPKLNRRLARLQQEADALALALQQAKESGEWQDKSIGEQDAEDESKLADLNQAIKSLHISAHGPASPASRMTERISSHPPRPPLNIQSKDHSSFPPLPTPQDTSRAESAYTTLSSPQALALHTALSSRLDHLETLVGLNSLPHPQLPEGRDPPLPLLPMAMVMQKQLNLLTLSDGATISGLGKRIQKLHSDAEAMEEKRRSAKARWEELRETVDTTIENSTSPSNSGFNYSRPGMPILNSGKAAGDAQGDLLDPLNPLTPPDLPAKLSALHSSLPAIGQLSPLLPPVLERLKALRGVHQDAGATSARLGEVEEKEQSMREDVVTWMEKLKEVEGNLKEAEGKWGGNVGVVEEWVRRLEERVEKLGGAENAG